MYESVAPNNATAENRIEELDPSGIIRITGAANGQIEMGESQSPIAVVGTPAIRESFGHS
jgi:hypothetical protein